MDKLIAQIQKRIDFAVANAEEEVEHELIDLLCWIRLNIKL